MKKTVILAIALLIAVASAACADTIAYWDYNGSNYGPTIGAGTQSLVGANAFTAFVSDTGSADPAANSTTGAYNTNKYDATGRGIMWAVSTSGYSDIVVSWDWKRSTTGAQNWALQYTTNGSTWTNAASYTLSSDIWFNSNSYSFGSTVANSSAFAFRLVNTSAASSSAGTMRFDTISVNGTAVPEPGAIAVFVAGLAGMGGVVVRRNRK